MMTCVLGPSQIPVHFHRLLSSNKAESTYPAASCLRFHIQEPDCPPPPQFVEHLLASKKPIEGVQVFRNRCSGKCAPLPLSCADTPPCSSISELLSPLQYADSHSVHQRQVGLCLCVGGHRGDDMPFRSYAVLRHVLIIRFLVTRDCSQQPGACFHGPSDVHQEARERSALAMQQLMPRRCTMKVTSLLHVAAASALYSFDFLPPLETTSLRVVAGCKNCDK